MSEYKPRSFGPYKYLPLPPGFRPKYATIDQVCSYACQSRWTTFAKIRAGRYRTIKDGRITKVEFDSVVEDFERLKAGAVKEPVEPVQPVAKRPVGRPRKHPKPEPANASAAE
jgi:hypothetical protein